MKDAEGNPHPVFISRMSSRERERQREKTPVFFPFYLCISYYCMQLHASKPQKSWCCFCIYFFPTWKNIFVLGFKCSQNQKEKRMQCFKTLPSHMSWRQRSTSFDRFYICINFTWTLLFYISYSHLSET